MEERCRRLLVSRAYKNYSVEMLDVAVDLVRKKEISSIEAEKRFFIPRRTIENKVKCKHIKQPGGQLKLSEAEEQNIVDVLIAAGDFGSPLSRFDLSLVVFNYLKANKREYIFNNKPPGKWWIKNFLTRHKNKLSTRTVQNIKKVRAAKTYEEFEMYFENLKSTLHLVPPCNILNYDETNLSDNPGSSKCIYKRATKYPERVIDHTKGNISIMFAAAADGTLLPTYTVYKAEHLWKTWCDNGPSNARYNRTKSGWFDATVFEDWFEKVVIPWAEKLEGPKVVIGDNLSSHLNVNIIRLCEEKNIRFSFLPPNSTHISQPLDVAFFAPLKKKWRQILTNYKYENPAETQLNKAHFPFLLKTLLEAIEETRKQNIISGFRATGIEPFNPQKIFKKLPTYDEKNRYSIDSALLDYLKKTRSAKPVRKIMNKKLNIAPGTSVSSQEIQMLVKKNTKSSAGKRPYQKPVSHPTCSEILFPSTSSPIAEMEVSHPVQTSPIPLTYTPELSIEPQLEVSHSDSPFEPENEARKKVCNKKVTILSEVKYNPFNSAYTDIRKSQLNLSKIDISHDIYSPHCVSNDKRVQMIDYDNPTPSTSKDNLDATLNFPRDKKCNSKYRICTAKKQKPPLPEDTDESSEDYSLKDSSGDEGYFISKASTLEMRDSSSDLDMDTEEFEKLDHVNLCNSGIGVKEVGSFFLVKFRGQKSNKFYVGKLIELTEGSGMMVKFMRKRKGDLFYWPDVNDISYIVDTDVEMILTNPLEGRRGTFKFNVDFKKYNVQ